MKSFIFKIINLLLICATFFIYQGFADARAAEISAYNTANEQVAQAEAAAAKASADAASEEAANQYKDGDFTGTGTGFGGDVTVQITISDDVITDAILVSADQETPDYINKAVALLDDMVSQQTADVDTVSGATFSSNGLIEAANNALKEASNE